MRECVERDAVMQALCDASTPTFYQGKPTFLVDCVKAVNSVPAVDARPVARSHWEIQEVDHAHGSKLYHCPECEADEWRYDRANFCPYCGADMREAVE